MNEGSGWQEKLVCERREGKPQWDEIPLRNFMKFLEIPESQTVKT